MKKLTANPAVLAYWQQRNKCWMCKHRFDKPPILPVDKPEPGKLQPKFNVEWAFHMADTHGMPQEYVPRYIFNSIYGIKNTFKNLYSPAEGGRPFFVITEEDLKDEPTGK